MASGDEPRVISAQDVPQAVIGRLSLYVREIQQWQRNGKETISSNQLGKLLGFTDAQVRKDLAYFGQFGCPGVGYRCQELVEAIKRILGSDRIWNVALIGCGHLGQALLGYRGFSRQGFQIVGAFDQDRNRVGELIGGFPITHMDDFPKAVVENEIRMAILAVPAAVAQEAADYVVQAGIAGILNFAPVSLSLPKHVRVIGVDLAIELEQLAFAVVRGQEGGNGSSGG